MSAKTEFAAALQKFSKGLSRHISTGNDQWAVKGFVDAFRNVYTISSDTKIISKILEIHLFPKIMEFAGKSGYKVVLPEHQNHYPDISFILPRKAKRKEFKFAVDFKTTYRLDSKRWLCNGFTLGSHGTYFRDRNSTKNIRFPYGSYSGHFCLGIIYDRNQEASLEETRQYSIDDLHSITSVISNIQFFVAEKWRIASDKRGSGNTANIGSIQRIQDIVDGNGMFRRLGENWFNDYWMNYGRITTKKGKIASLEDFVKYRKGNPSLIVPRNNLK
ncbi:MAG: restriction endonuclease [Gammaproteobacteria bacterium]|nr:restriction endonuclease [Gammaproteobacteria bacterium]